MRILAIPNGVNGAGYYRMFLPLSHLARNSAHEVQFPPPAEVIAPQGFWLAAQDVIAGHQVGPDGLAMWRSWKGDAPLVYDADDSLTAAEARWHPGLAKYADPGMRAAFDEALRLSDLVTCSTPVIAERAARVNPAVVVLPNYVNAELLGLERPRRERVTLGWHGSATHLEDIRFHAAPLARFLRQHPEVDLHLAGADYRPLLGRPDARFSPWRVDMWDHYRNIDFDIGLAPLAPNAFNDAKSHVKALEYAALGIPVVASDCPAYRDFVVDGETGFLVRYDHEWGKRLRELACDEQMRQEMGDRARRHAARFTIQEHWPEWEAAYEKVTR